MLFTVRLFKYGIGVHAIYIIAHLSIVTFKMIKFGITFFICHNAMFINIQSYFYVAVWYDCSKSGIFCTFRSLVWKKVDLKPKNLSDSLFILKEGDTKFYHFKCDYGKMCNYMFINYIICYMISFWINNFVTL
jgi:hypothetical protein